jgi:hypothetical protein
MVLHYKMRTIMRNRYEFREKNETSHFFTIRHLCRYLCCFLSLNICIIRWLIKAMRETKIILLPQYILFPQERYFVPTTLLSCSLNISYCSLNILLLIPELLKTLLWHGSSRVSSAIGILNGSSL